MELAISESLNCVSDDHEIEELEITEVDEALLRNLMEEAVNEETGEDGVNYAVHNPEANNDSTLNICEQDLKQHGLHIHDLDWDDMMDVTPASSLTPMDETMVWYIADMVGMVEFGWDGDYSQYYNGVICDETNYCCLWQE
ncbi:Activity-dependent neuroprotector homeobox protein [Melia azedarach]|uniref:Activity-dependent neuroprotector homeobox protein n=1 Tax=Melia azedarach TaxID=155640 RepID=A0ACC1YZQ2_MELAZ|nr:Activity-dependent neuroprotector homeobox protein [Melia azedarach]